MWNSFNTAGPVSVTAEIVTYPGGGGDVIHAYVARPLGDEPLPGIVLVHYLPGFDEFHQETAERLARHGYEVICPDLYCRRGHGTPDELAAKIGSEPGHVKGRPHDDQVVADCEAALAWLRAQPRHSGKAGIVGDSSGGRHALLVASLVPGFDAVIDMWGGRVTAPPPNGSPEMPVAPIEYTDRLTAPLLGIFGNDDRNPSPEQVDLHEQALKNAGKEYEFHRYDGVGHSFTCYHAVPHGEMERWFGYKPKQAMDAWEKIFGFLADKLSA
jgi:carboxymethylenebutenolidase